MAKKKVTQNGKVQDQDKPQEDKQTRIPKSTDSSAEKLANLKSLNSKLLQETVDRRQFVESLQQYNMALGTELTRSKMEKERLLAELSQASDDSMGLELENSLVGLFVASHLDGFRERVSGFLEERDGLLREKVEREKRMEGLEREVRGVCRERDEIERMRKKGECEIKVMKGRVDELVGVLEGEGDLLRRVSQERDGLKTELSVKIEEGNCLKLDMLELEKCKASAQEALRKLRIDFSTLSLEKEEKGKAIESLLRDKTLVTDSLRESMQKIEALNREIKGIFEERRNLEEVNVRQEMRLSELEKEVSQQNEIVSLLRDEEDRMRVKISEMEKTMAEAVEKEKMMEMKLTDILEAKEEKERQVETLVQEKELVKRNLQECVKQFEAEKLKMDELVQEKMKVEDVKGQHENTILELETKVNKLSNTIVNSQKSSEDLKRINEELHGSVAGCERDIDRLMHEKGTALKCLDDEKRSGLQMKSRISEMERTLDENVKLLEQVRNEHRTLTEEKKGVEADCKLLLEDKTAVERNFAEAQKGIDSMRVKMESADVNAKRALAMLKNTSTSLSSSKLDGNGKLDMLVEEQQTEEDIQPYAAALDAISSAFRDKEVKAQEMKKQLEVLQSSVANERKKSFWALLSSPVTAVCAAALGAYIAKGRQLV